MSVTATAAATLLEPAIGSNEAAGAVPAGPVPAALVTRVGARSTFGGCQVPLRIEGGVSLGQ